LSIPPIKRGKRRQERTKRGLQKGVGKRRAKPPYQGVKTKGEKKKKKKKKKRARTLPKGKKRANQTKYALSSSVIREGQRS